MNYDRFIQVLQEQFPAAEISQYESLFTNDLIDDDSCLRVGNSREEEKRLETLRHHLNAAYAAYQELHPEVRAKLSGQFRENSVKRLSFAAGTTIVVKGDMVRRGAYLSNVLRATIYSLTGRPPEFGALPPDLLEQPSALHLAKEEARKLTPKTGAARKKETWRKVALVQHAIRCWQRYGCGEPDIGSDAFLNLVQGLADALDPEASRGWDAGNLIRSYRRSKSKLGT